MLNPPWYAAQSSVFSKEFIDSQLNWAAWERWQGFRSSCLRISRPRGPPVWYCPPSPLCRGQRSPLLWSGRRSACILKCDLVRTTAEVIQATRIPDRIKPWILVSKIVCCFLSFSLWEEIVHLCFFNRFIYNYYRCFRSLFVKCRNDDSCLDGILFKNSQTAQQLPPPHPPLQLTLSTSHSHPLFILWVLGHFCHLSAYVISHCHTKAFGSTSSGKSALYSFLYRIILWAQIIQ